MIIILFLLLLLLLLTRFILSIFVVKHAHAQYTLLSARPRSSFCLFAVDKSVKEEEE